MAASRLCSVAGEPRSTFDGGGRFPGFALTRLACSVFSAFVFSAFVSSAFVSVATMPGWMQAFARNQPNTPLIDTLRGWLIGGDGNAIVAFAWVVGLAVAGAAAASFLFARRAT